MDLPFLVLNYPGKSIPGNLLVFYQFTFLTIMTDPPHAHKGDPPAHPFLTRVPVVETIPQTPSSDSSAHPTPFQ